MMLMGTSSRDGDQTLEAVNNHDLALARKIVQRKGAIGQRRKKCYTRWKVIDESKMDDGIVGIKYESDANANADGEGMCKLESK